jgi:hypothetical protein
MLRIIHRQSKNRREAVFGFISRHLQNIRSKQQLLQDTRVSEKESSQSETPTATNLQAEIFYCPSTYELVHKRQNKNREL